jgi:flagellar basal body-associated protein FliL
MAEKPDRKSDAASGPASSAQAQKKEPAKKASFLTSTPVVIGGVMLMEALILFAGFKLIGGGGPVVAHGASLKTSESGSSHEGATGGGEGEGEGGKPSKPVDKNQAIELKVVDFKAPNRQNGRTFLYDISIYLSTKAERQEEVAAKLQENDARIRDRIRTIMAQADPDKLGGGSEPGLETLRRQVKYQLDEIIGEGAIDEVLIPRCIPYRADY